MRKGMLMALTATPTMAFAQDQADTGNTAWILCSTALVLFMSLPGLALAVLRDRLRHRRG